MSKKDSKSSIKDSFLSLGDSMMSVKDWLASVFGWIGNCGYIWDIKLCAINSNFMREPIIHIEDSNLEYNLWGTNYLKYKGELFTGTITDDETNPISFTEYKNGDYDGEQILYHKNGKLAEKSIYEDGNYIEGQEWYSDGQLKFQCKLDSRIYWDKDGIVAYQDGNWLYKNGKVKKDYKENQYSTLYASNGEKAIITEFGKLVNKQTYYHNNLLENYFEILINLYPEIDSNYSNIKFDIFGWINQIYLRDKILGEKLLVNLFSHPTSEVKEFAVHLHSFIEQKKNGNTEKTYWLEGDIIEGNIKFIF